jgi:mono/diheme cytochrome c family protein
MQLVHATLEAPVLRRSIPSVKVHRIAPRRRPPRRSNWLKLILRSLIVVLALASLVFGAGYIARKAEVKRMIAQADPKRGRSYYKQSCIVCHGANYQGMPHQGVSLRDSKFIASNSDEALWNFLKSGRKPTDKASLLKLEMPPRGANPSLDDEDLMDVVVFLRTVSVGEISNSK